MNNCKISINQLADFTVSTEAKRKSIIRQQKNPNPFRVAWYQLPRARFKKSIQLGGDLDPVFDGIEILKNRVPEKPRQVLDRTVSLEAMRRFTQLKLPSLLGYPLQIIKKVEVKTIWVNGVEIIISPDVMFKTNIDGIEYLGAVKIHISKNNIFDREQSLSVSSMIHHYLKENFETDLVKVMPSLCLSIDIFGERVVSSPKNIIKSLVRVEKICDEVKNLWSAA